MRTLTQDPYSSVRYKGWSFTEAEKSLTPQPPPHPPEKFKKKKNIVLGRGKNKTFNLTQSPNLTKAKSLFIKIVWTCIIF